jgi:ribosomal protein S18 acetylase RimI-like enzyme
MSQKLTDFSPDALVRANRANLYELFRYFERSPYMEFTRGSRFARWSSPFQYAWFNGLLCERDATPADSALIEDSLAYYRARDTHEISFWLEDGVNLAGWQSLLEPRGFRLVQGPPGMSVDLELLNEAGSLPDGAYIKPVHDEQGVQDCAEVLIHGYGFPVEWKSLAADFVRGLGLEAEAPLRSYVAYWDGKPVSTAAGLFGQQVVGIFNVATLPEARGKGFGGALTSAPLLEARAMGYRVGTLQSSEQGFPIYKKLGFEQNCWVGSFFYTF